MEKQKFDHLPLAARPEAQPKRWIAPLQTIKAFSIAEFTQVDSSPGNDGNGTFTAS